MIELSLPPWSHDEVKVLLNKIFPEMVSLVLGSFYHSIYIKVYFSGLFDPSGLLHTFHLADLSCKSSPAQQTLSIFIYVAAVCRKHLLICGTALLAVSIADMYAEQQLEFRLPEEFSMVNNS